RFNAFSSAIIRWFLYCVYILGTMPLRGAKKNERKAMTEETTTIQGPVGMAGAAYEIYAPANPANAPNATAIQTIRRMLFVQYRAAAACVINMAAINTTPTAVMPVTTASTVRLVSRRSSLRTG